jgi:hypothetical protein
VDKAANHSTDVGNSTGRLICLVGSSFDNLTADYTAREPDARHKYVRLPSHCFSGLFFNRVEAKYCATRSRDETASLPPPPVPLGRTFTVPLTMADWSNAAWDSITAYRLSKETVDAFLQGLFGYYEFYTRVLLSLSTFSTAD